MHYAWISCEGSYDSINTQLHRRDLDLSCGRTTVTYTMNMIIALTACRDREAKVWTPKSMVYFSPCSTARRYTKSAQIFNITSQANGASGNGGNGKLKRKF